ncbi:hypothetical protein IWZ03DRAFT_425187 [Phyllosticta citriasiana]|uniref:Uncharacterized protein n=1 Tax=Phyllosticta citriasiana TaxID=595635 RepID=A0ABR1KIX5_9PEZI
MASRRTSTRSFTSKLNSEPSSYQSGVWEGRISHGSSSSSSSGSISEAALPPQYMPSPIPETPNGQPKRHKKPRRPRRPSLISAPLGTFALIPQLIALGLVFSALMGKLLLDYFGTPSDSITPAPADFGWIEYIPHARVSVARFSSAATAQKGGDEDVAFALASPRHFGFARAAWRVFGAVDANANWTDPRKTQPTERESFACRERLRAEYARLAGIWSPLRAEYVNRTISSYEKRMEHRLLLKFAQSHLQLQILRLKLTLSLSLHAFSLSRTLLFNSTKTPSQLHILDLQAFGLSARTLLRSLQLLTQILHLRTISKNRREQAFVLNDQSLRGRSTEAQ